MALYHFSVRHVSRGKGQMVVASAAYISGQRIYDGYYNKIHDYTSKSGVVFTEILTPEYVPERLTDRETLWNEVEHVERNNKAQLAYSFDIALQNELTLEENIRLAKEFCQEQFVARGMIVDLAVHEGKSENEAVGTGIAEFGNLDERAEDLGIKQFVHQPRQEQTPNAVSLSMEDVRQFLREHSRHSYFVALSIFLFILSACCPIFFGAAADTSLRSSDVLDASGVILMFVFIAIGVGMLVYSNVCMGHWKHLEEGNFVTDFATTDYIHHEMEHYKSTHALLLTIGIMLCILSVVPPILLDAASSFAADTLEDCSAGFVLIFVAIGVFLLVISSMRMGGYRTLLHLNNQNTIGGNYVPEQQDRQQYHNSTLAAIMSVYWPTITCLYLIWSFLSFDWWITWIVWPIAAIVESLIKNISKN